MLSIFEERSSLEGSGLTISIEEIGILLITY